MLRYIHRKTLAVAMVRPLRDDEPSKSFGDYWVMTALDRTVMTKAELDAAYEMADTRNLRRDG